MFNSLTKLILYSRYVQENYTNSLLFVLKANENRMFSSFTRVQILQKKLYNIFL